MADFQRFAWQILIVSILFSGVFPVVPGFQDKGQSAEQDNSHGYKNDQKIQCGITHGCSSFITEITGTAMTKLPPVCSENQSVKSGSNQTDENGPKFAENELYQSSHSSVPESYGVF